MVNLLAQFGGKSVWSYREAFRAENPLPVSKFGFILPVMGDANPFLVKTGVRLAFQFAIPNLEPAND
jgi:hypothetical protein